MTLTAWVYDRNESEIALLSERFSRRHPEVDLNLMLVPPERRREMLMAAIRSRSLPDVIVAESAMLPLLGRLDLICDLLPLAQADGLDLASMLEPWDYQRTLVGSRHLALPAFSEALGGLLFLADGLFEQAGLDPTERMPDWPAFVARSQALVAKLNSPAQLKFIALDPYQVSTLTFLAFGSGNPLVSADGRQSRLTEPGVVNALRAMDDYVEAVYGPWGGYRGLLAWRAINVIQRRDAARTFAFGTKACHIASSIGVGILRRIDPQLRFHAQPVPGLRGLQGGIAMHGPSYAVRKDAASIPLAWELAKFLSIDPEGGVHLCINRQRFTAVKRFNEGSAFSEPAHLWAAVREAAKLDVLVTGPAGDDVLGPPIFAVPLHRLAGSSVEEIAEKLHLHLQAALDAQRDLPLPA